LRTCIVRILKIEIGIAHLESALPVTDRSVTEQLRQAISQLDSRLTEVESKLSGVNITAPNPSSDTSSNEKILTDIELSNLLNVSNLLIRDYRVKGKKPKGQVLAKALTEEWEIKGEGWVKKSLL
jgi:ParB family transcriptional regulator, chromosome partitioning protein